MSLIRVTWFFFFFPVILSKTDTIFLSFLTSWQIGIAIRAAKSGHLPNYGFVLVSLGSTAVLLIAVRALLYAVLPVDNSKKSDVYRRGSPFELFEVHNLFIFISSEVVMLYFVKKKLCIKQCDTEHNTKFVSFLLQLLTSLVRRW